METNKYKSVGNHQDVTKYSQTPIRSAESPREEVIDNIKMREILYGPRPIMSMSTEEYTSHLMEMTKERRSKAEELMEAHLKTMGIEIVKHE